MDTQKSIRENTSDLEKKLTGLNTTKEPLSAEKKKEHEKQVQEAKEKRLEKEQTGKKLPDRQALKK